MKKCYPPYYGYELRNLVTGAGIMSLDYLRLDIQVFHKPVNIANNFEFMYS
jgi:hypothetical protein